MYILVNKDNPQIWVLTLNRPDKRNALSIAVMEEFSSIIDDASRDPHLRVIILNGNGAVFCAGLDLSEIADQEKSHLSSALVAKTLTALYKTPVVTIAAVHGAAIAGGAGIMSACDFALAAPGTKIGYPETRRGLVAAQVMPFLLRQLRQRDIRELLLFGELIEPERALQMGLINRIVPQTELLNEAIKYARLVLKGAPAATAKSKSMLDEMYPSDFEMELERALACHRSFRDSSEAKEGALSFLEGRSPSWER